MARPTKEGLGYFPLDTDIDQDEKIIVVVAKYKMRGFGVIVRLMMEVYKNGYFYHWTEKEQYVFSMKVAEPVEFINEVVQDCLKWGFFHQEMFNKFGILTSKGFQKRYMLAVNRRKDAHIKSEYDLRETVIDDNNYENDDINEEVESTQPTKENKRKENKSNKDISVYQTIIGHLNTVAGKNFSYKSEANKKLINGRMNEGRTIEDFIHVIDVKCSQWLNDPKMEEYIRPSTLFGQKNFENYVNEKAPQPKQPVVDPRDRDIAFQNWVQEGHDPDEFDWGK